MRPLGSTGIEVSALGLGTVKLGRRERVSYPKPFRIPTDDEAGRLLDTAADLGVNLLDTAPAYGESEARLGRLLKGQRSRWVLCTKVGEIFEDRKSHFDFRPEAVTASVERSLARLQTDFLDIVLIHSSGDDVAILDHSGALACLEELRTSGLIRAIGISHKTAAGAHRALTLGCDVLMSTLSSAERGLAPVVAEAGKAGCGVLVKKALASGHAGLDSLVWAARQPGVSSVVVGTIDPEHLRADALALQAS